jgi:hypothetical protein
MTVYLTDIERHQWPVRNVRAEFFVPGQQPVSTKDQISKYAVPGMHLQIDAIAAT